MNACPNCKAPIANGACAHEGGCLYMLTLDELRSGSISQKIDHPTHYNEHPSGIECVVIAEHMGFNIGNALKYLWRAGLKDGSPTEEDYRKAIWYINREIAKIAKEKT